MSESLGEAVEGLGSFLMENSEEDVEAATAAAEATVMRCPPKTMKSRWQ